MALERHIDRTRLDGPKSVGDAYISDLPTCQTNLKVATWVSQTGNLEGRSLCLGVRTNQLMPCGSNFPPVPRDSLLDKICTPLFPRAQTQLVTGDLPTNQRETLERSVNKQIHSHVFPVERLACATCFT
jgi:hypothetical protein